MSHETIMLILGLSGLNLLAIIGIVWKGGRLLGGFENSISGWGKEISRLSTTSLLHGELIARTAATLDAVEGRVTRLETRLDNA